MNKIDYDSLMICNLCTREVFDPEDFNEKEQTCCTCQHIINQSEEYEKDV